MNELADKVRRICVRLLDVPLDSSEGRRYRFELKNAALQLAEQQKQWDKASQLDEAQGEAWQSCRSRETDSDTLEEGLKLFNSAQQDSQEKKSN